MTGSVRQSLLFNWICFKAILTKRLAGMNPARNTVKFYQKRSITRGKTVSRKIPVKVEFTV